MNFTGYKKLFPGIAGIFSLLFLLASLPSQAQKERKEIRSGNSKYENGNYADAETDYRKALEKNKNSLPGSYNLGGSLYKQKKYDEAIQQYNEAVAKAVSPEEKAQSLHNLGNAMVQSQKFEEGVNAYKQALKLNPNDDDTRYNLAYAKAMLRQQQQQQQQQNNDQNQNKDQQKQDQKNQNDQKKDQQENKDNENQNQNDQQDQKKQEQQKEQARQQPKISKEDAERILKALQNDEKNLQDKMQMKEGQRVRVEKDW